MGYCLFFKIGSKECERVTEDGPRMERGVGKDDGLLGGRCQDWRGLWSIHGMIFMSYGVFALCFVFWIVRACCIQ